MGRMVTFDLDSAIAKAKILADEAPGMLAMAEAAGWGGAAGLGKYAPLLTPLASMLDKLVGRQDGLSSPGMPDTGPRGKGRMQYLRNKRGFADADVVRACESIAMGGFANSKTVADTVNYTLACMYSDTPHGTWSTEQTRKAIDQILESDGLSEGVCDKLGDMIWVFINSKQAVKSAKEG